MEERLEGSSKPLSGGQTFHSFVVFSFFSLGRKGKIPQSSDQSFFLLGLKRLVL